MGIPHWVLLPQLFAGVTCHPPQLQSSMRAGFILFLGFFIPPPPPPPPPTFLLLLLLSESAWGGGKALGYIFLRRLFETLSALFVSGLTATITGNTAEQPPSPVAAKSSLLHQQHGESRREKENNRGNGAREGGFKPPLTTDKQHRQKGLKERRKTPGVDLYRRFGRHKMDSRV